MPNTGKRRPRWRPEIQWRAKIFPLAVLTRNHAIAVELDFVQPAGTGRWRSARAGWQGRMKPGGLERDRIGRETRQGPAFKPAAARIPNLGVACTKSPGVEFKMAMGRGEEPK